MHGRMGPGCVAHHWISVKRGFGDTQIQQGQTRCDREYMIHDCEATHQSNGPSTRVGDMQN